MLKSPQNGWHFGNIRLEVRKNTLNNSQNFMLSKDKMYIMLDNTEKTV